MSDQDTTGAVWRQFSGPTNARLRFDFDFIYCMHTADGPRLFTESADVALFMEWPNVVGMPKPGKRIEGFGAPSVQALVLGVRSRWHDPNDPAEKRLFTPTRLHEGQKSVRQMLILMLSPDGDGLPVTVSAKSTASGRLFEAQALCNRASTRAKASPGGPSVLPPTYTWRLKLTAESRELSKGSYVWASREIVPTYDGERGDLDGLCATREQFARAHELQTSVGALWAESWGEPVGEPEEQGGPEGPVSDEALEQGPAVPDAVARQRARQQAADEATARDEAALLEAQRAARERNAMHETGAL